MKIRHKGWVPDVPDHRDLKYAALRGLATKALPPAVDLTGSMPPVYDQGQLGSCTANAIAAAIDYCRAIEGKPLIVPSRLFIYYNERKMEGTVSSDAGAMIRDGVKSASKQGVCHEKKWPYVIKRFKRVPPVTCYRQALRFQTLSYHRIDNTNLSDLLACLAEGYPFVFGFSVYDGFESAEVARTGVLNMPQKGERLLGGHAVLACGYDKATGRLKVRNSWGEGWGQAGYFTMPFEYATDTNLADDFWTLRVVE